MNKTQQPGLERIRCKECGVQPEAFWDTEIATIALACECGERMVPRDCVIEHDMMPDGVEWTYGDGEVDG